MGSEFIYHHGPTCGYFTGANGRSSCTVRAVCVYLKMTVPDDLLCLFTLDVSFSALCLRQTYLLRDLIVRVVCLARPVYLSACNRVRVLYLCTQTVSVCFAVPLYLLPLHDTVW